MPINLPYNLSLMSSVWMMELCLNLAVVCDADQIIRMNIDKKNKNTVSFESGGIENPNMNNHVLDILEGTYNAFTNSSDKYSIVNRR